MPTSLLQSLSRLAAPDGRTDAALVAAFLATADQPAFAELVRRHGPAVLGVCRRVLGPTPDAEDAFQATFLVLVRRARTTEWRASLGPWLYGVALKVARKARAARARRVLNERAGAAMSEPNTPPTEPDDAGAAVDEELAALPELYRAPLVLCEIQGASRRDAARELGLSEGTLSSRLARGRKLLRDRLAARGVVPVVAGLSVAVPAGLAGATVRNAVHVLSRTAGAVPAGVLFLTDGVTKAMMAKWKLTLAMVATCVALTGVGAWRGSEGPAAAAKAADEPKAPAKPVAPPERCEAHQEAVATIFGNVPITRDQFMDHLLRRYGRKELELYVNKQIIAHAFARKGFTLKPGEVSATLDEECKVIGLTRDKFVAEVLPRYGNTLEQWTEDVIEPRVMLTRMLKTKLPPITEAELRQKFDARFGERMSCRIIVWTKDEGEAARNAAARIAANRSDFDSCARASSNPLANAGGLVKPIPRKPGAGANAVERAAAKLKTGEISPLIETDTGFVLVKCDALVPPDRTKSFDAEKAALLADLAAEQVEREIPKLFDELKREARPQYHLTFPEPTKK